MRILHVTKKYPNAIGGDASCIYHLEEEQQKKGHTVFILTANSREIVNKYNLYRFGLRDTAYNWDNVTAKRITSLLFFIVKSLLVIEKTKPDIIHSHSADLGFLISIWAKLLRIPIINTCHTLTFPNRYVTRLKRYPELMCLRLGLFNTITIAIQGGISFLHAYGIRNCELLNVLGVDIEEFDKVKSSIVFRKNRDYRIFIFVGRIDNLKGLNYLLQASSQLRRYTDKFKIWIIGDGPYKEKLRRLSNDLGLGRNLKFFKTVITYKRLIKIYCLCDVFVLPSLLETFSLVILEAWAAGLAVISTRVGIIAELGKEGENVIIVSKNDQNALFSAMSALLKDGLLAKKIAQGGRKTIEKNFTWETVSSNLEKLYIRCLHSKAYK